MSDNRRTLAWACIGLLIGALAIAILSVPVLTAQIRATQVQNTQKNDARDQELRVINKVARRIESCTTPNKPCWKRSQRQTAQAVGDINRVVILAAACASQMPGASVERITRCVADGRAES